VSRLRIAALFCAAAALFVFAAGCFGQQLSKEEQDDLSRALADANGSPKDYLRGLQKHLEKYPDSPRKAELERAAALAAFEAKDDAALVLYGERTLARHPDDLQMLEPVARALTASDSKDAAERALKYARRYETLARGMQSQRPHDAEWQNRTDQAIARGLTYEARATAALGRAEEALALAERAFATYPGAEAAREIARSDERLGRIAEAARAMADAFTVQDARNTDAERARDRGRMGELYRKARVSEAGLGDLVLEAYDRNLALVHARELRMRANDPNAQLTDPMQFTLSALDGAPLRMAELKGKVVILDVWATWCGPCRAQHPLYEQVKQRFAGSRDVVFLSINSDEDRAAVRPFLDEVKWAGPVYFEDGLARALKINGIPATIIIGRDGQVFSRMSGFVPELFVDSLTAKIKDALR
jgi:thiol-disulfide isomerase/thioredoxin